MKTIADVLPFAVSRLRGDKGSQRAASHFIVVLIDGLGALNIRDHGEFAPDWLLDSEPINTTFPSTTPVSLMSLGTASHAGLHGMLGATVRTRFGLLQPLQWKENPHPELFQPQQTVFQRAADEGIAVTRVGPQAYAHSGLTQAALRGGVHLAAESLDEILARTENFLKSAAPALMYAYYPKLDKVGHIYGVNSAEWLEEFQLVMDLLNGIQRQLGPHQELLVTADHGMVDVEHRLWIEDDTRLTRDLQYVTGEPRMRHLYAIAGYEKNLLRNWQSISEFADIYDREEFVSHFLEGAVRPEYREHIGDVVAVAKGTNSIGSRNVDVRVSQLIGMHGSDTPTEKLIPASVVSG